MAMVVKIIYDITPQMVEYTGDKLPILGDFLVSDDCISTIDRGIIWLKDGLLNGFRGGCVGGNLYGIYEDDGKIKVERDFDDPEDENLKFSTSPERMLEILIEWEKILKMDPWPAEILIEQENDDSKVTFQIKEAPVGTESNKERKREYYTLLNKQRNTSKIKAYKLENGILTSLSEEIE